MCIGQPLRSPTSWSADCGQNWCTARWQHSDDGILAPYRLAHRGSVVELIIGGKLDPTRLDDMTVIGVDELPFRKRYNYVPVVVDHMRQRIVWVGEACPPTHSGSSSRRSA